MASVETQQTEKHEDSTNIHPHVVLTPENNKRVLRKIDINILPVILAIYFLQALDKDTNLVGQQYSWLGAIVYVAQLVAQPVIAYILVKFPLGKFMAATTLCWGISLTCMTAAHNFGGLMASRMFLGLFEAGVAPAFIALTQMWWRRREQPVRLGSWYAMNGITNMFGSLLTWGIAHINSPVLREYQLIFLFFGLITVVYSFAVYWLLPDSPEQARFFDSDDKMVAVERMRENQQGNNTHEWKWDHVKEALRDYKTWGWAAMMFSISVPSGGISTFGPLIIRAFGYDQFQTILFNIPFGAVQLVATMGGAYAATKLRMKAPILAFLSLPPIAGCVMLLYLPRSANVKAPLLVAYYLISVYPGITPLIYSWSAANTAGETKKKVVTGFLFIFQCAGNILGPNLYTPAERPLYRRGLLSNLALFVVLIALYAIQATYIFFLNKSHAARRVAIGKREHVIDRSMLKVQRTYNDSKDEEYEQQEAAADVNLEDKTDMENESFIYVY
ncbi:MFS-type transporter-like protein 44 [Elsinoe fawcettii]|nr:MFS-type transporter-like protein 44 [Elsinoe fawcettii]